MTAFGFKVHGDNIGKANPSGTCYIRPPLDAGLERAYRIPGRAGMAKDMAGIGEPTSTWHPSLLRLYSTLPCEPRLGVCLGRTHPP